MTSKSPQPQPPNDIYSTDITEELNEFVNAWPSYTDDISDDRIDMKSNASSKHRGSVSYSQPSSPQSNNASFGNAHTDSDSTLSDLSTEFNDDGDSESCASLNSNDSSFRGQLIEFEMLNTEDTIHEYKENIANTVTQSKKPKKAKKKKQRKNSLTKSISFKKNASKKSKNTKRRNSKDCLDITLISRLTLKKIQKWSVSEVVQWIQYIEKGKYREHGIKFQNKKIDGKKLYKLNRTMLQSMEIYHPCARKAILANLHKLKTKVRQTSKKQIKLRRNKHIRGVSNLELSKTVKSEMYVIAVKKEKKKVLGISKAKSEPKMKRNSTPNIAQFLDAYNIESNVNFVGSQILAQTKNFTMIKLRSDKVVYVVTAKVEKWSNSDVCTWLNSVANGRFQRFIATFKQRNTNGFDLLNISRVQLQNHIKMKNSEMRNTLLREIKLLKIATKPQKRCKFLKKRASALSVRDLEKAHKKTHRKSKSLLSASVRRSNSQNDLYDTFAVPRKLGPRDIGRQKGYKGTKWERQMFNYDFLEEKLNYKAKTAYFEQRRQRNPVKHKETVDQIGTAQGFVFPQNCDEILRNMRRGQWLADKPLSRRNLFLDQMRGHKIEKSPNMSEINAPIGWSPIEYTYEKDKRAFLEEHFWFDGSGVQFDFGVISRILQYLPSQKLLALNSCTCPTGYESKLNWLKMLLRLVTEEMAIITKEDAIMKMESESVGTDGNTMVCVTQSVGDICESAKVGLETESEETKNECLLSLPQSVLSVALESDSSDASEQILSSPNSSLASPDMKSKRTLYKRARHRANTALANSTLLNGVSSHRNGNGAQMSRHDQNRRRFISLESVTSIQAIIAGIEKKRSEGNYF